MPGVQQRNPARPRQWHRLSDSSVIRLALFGCFLGQLLEAEAASGVRSYLDKPKEWFRSAEAARIATNVLSYQCEFGGWPKNVDTTTRPHPASRSELRPTFDNGATTGELRFLGRSVQATGNPAHRAAFERGFHYILHAQYKNGGWPQSFPPGNSYARHITFNDDALVRLMEFLRETYTSDIYGFIPESEKLLARQAFERGVQCILKCQVRVKREAHRLVRSA